MEEKTGTVASAEEVLRVLTAILRGEAEEDTAVPTGERRRAAELLARHYGILTPADSGMTEARRRAVAAVEAAVEAMRREVTAASDANLSSGG